MQKASGEEMVTIKATFTVDPEKFAWGMYNANITDRGPRPDSASICSRP